MLLEFGEITDGHFNRLPDFVLNADDLANLIGTGSIAC